MRNDIVNDACEMKVKLAGFIKCEYIHLEALPGQRAPVEVHEDVAEALHVVSPRLLDPEVRVDRGVSVHKIPGLYKGNE